MHYLLLIGVLASLTGCDTTPDKVDPSYYGQMTAGRAAAPATSQISGIDKPVQAVAAVSGDAGVMAKPSASTAKLDSIGTPVSPSKAPAASMSSSGGATSNTSCDMSGRWLQTVHKTTDGLGNLQYSHVYWYYEIAQQGDALMVKKSLFCGTDTIGGGTFAVTLDFSKAEEGLRTHVKDDGRKGSSTRTSDGCKVEFEKSYVVFGATLPYYLDPSTTLPTAEEPASAGKPGWEDWDGDGNPGITGVCSGTVTGKIFTAPREWNTLSGSVPNVSSMFKLAFNWDSEPNVMSFDGSPFLGSSAVRAADASLHFVQFARLSDDQATGDDVATCKGLKELALRLTPEAAGM